MAARVSGANRFEHNCIPDVSAGEADVECIQQPLNYVTGVLGTFKCRSLCHRLLLVLRFIGDSRPVDNATAEAEPQPSSEGFTDYVDQNRDRLRKNPQVRVKRRSALVDPVEVPLCST